MLGLALALLSPALAALSLAQDPTPKAPAAASPAPQEKLPEQLVAAAARELAEVGVQVDAGKVVIAQPDADEVAEILERFQVEAFGAEWFEMLWATLGAAGLPVEATAEEFRANYAQGVMQGQAAWYAPEGGRLLLSPQRPDGIDLSLLVAHELTHAAQDQREGLLRLLHGFGRTTDAMLVARSLIEGEAEAATLAVLQRRRGKDLNALPAALIAVQPAEQRDNAMRLHYALGRQHMVRALRSGGWPAVRAAFQAPPPHGAALAHPERELWPAPTALALPEWSAEAPPAALVRDDTWGELGLRMLLRFLDTDADQVRLAGLGWRGDALRLWRLESGGLVFVWRLAFDRDEDTEQLRALLAPRVQGQLTVRGQVLEWIAASDAALEYLLTATAALPLPAPADAALREATAALEQPILATMAKVTPAPDDGDAAAVAAPDRWTLPELGASLPLPPGFEARTIQNVQALLAPPADDEMALAFRDNLVAVVQPAPSATLDELEEQTRVGLAQPPNEAIVVEQRQLAGRTVLWLEYHTTNQAGRLHHVEAAWLREGQRLSVTGTGLETRWQVIGPVLTRAIEGLRFEGD
ncbi:MAG: hypothetical protein AB7O97_15255 [Planctomycetota bacterium]